MNFNTVCNVLVYKLIYKTTLHARKYKHIRCQQVCYMFQQFTGAIIRQSAHLLTQHPQNGSLYRNTVTLTHVKNCQLKHKNIHSTNIKTPKEMFLQVPCRLLLNTQCTHTTLPRLNPYLDFKAVSRLSLTSNEDCKEPTHSLHDA